MDASDVIFLKQHLIDPEICIRCNTCESVCPTKAITHDSNNYVVDAALCNLCMACVPPCPTGSIDNWRTVPRPWCRCKRLRPRNGAFLLADTSKFPR